MGGATRPRGRMIIPVAREAQGNYLEAFARAFSAIPASQSARPLGGPLQNERVRTLPTTPDAQLRITVIVPCVDEADTISESIHRARHALERSGIEGEFLVVDNGSRDDSGS